MCHRGAIQAEYYAEIHMNIKICMSLMSITLRENSRDCDEVGMLVAFNGGVRVNQHSTTV